MNNVFIAGATGYLGRYLCAEYQRRGWQVLALVRDKSRAGDLAATRLIEAEATQPASLRGEMAGADLVISALGITRQKDGLSYREVDYQANLNLLREAESAGVQRFAYIHVLNAERMAQVPLVAAKQAFVGALQSSRLASTIIAPSGYFSDMADFLRMAHAGRVWLFGSGSHRINPIHGVDLAAASAEAIAAEQAWLDVGGPEAFTQNRLAELAFAALNKKRRITHVPDIVRRAALTLLPKLTPPETHGPAQFFLTAMGMDMVGKAFGRYRLSDHFDSLAKSYT